MNFNELLPGVDWNYVVTALLGILATIAAQLLAARNGVHLAPTPTPAQPTPKPADPKPADPKAPQLLPFGGAFLPLIMTILQRLIMSKAGVADLDDHEVEALKALKPHIDELVK